MSVQYRPVKWNAFKRTCDGALAGGVGLYLALFVLLGRWLAPDAVDPVVLLLRALGSCALVLLHVVLCLGPLARLVPRLTPLVYNRRHLGVTTFLVAATHALLATGYYHGFGVLHPLVSLLASGTFELPGIVALLVLFLLAATSHDFWQKALTATAWKSLHMLVYPAYALVLLHVALGAGQTARGAGYLPLLFAGLVVVAGLHLLAGWRERRRDRGEAQPAAWVDAGCVDDIVEGRAKVLCLPGQERIAVFRHEGSVSAVTNVCAHQRGPLGEGKIVGGCITCPWHGWEYRPADGCSPPPFTEKIGTFRVRVEGRRILLDPTPLPAGTPTELALFEEKRDG
jgi:DMSO/TMAO reductase YedYZ heme-binding membrane subunit/nitrite reductase/ring-hydroxylating ferredoxin subunit